MLYGGLAWPGLAAVRGARCAVAGLSIEQLDNADSRSMFLGRWVLGVFFVRGCCGFLVSGNAYAQKFSW